MPFLESQRCQSLAAGAALIMLLAALAFATTTPRFDTPDRADESWRRWRAGQTVYHVDIPMEEPTLPDGPYRAEFTAVCRLCHSPRFPLSQPHLSEQKWREVVHKMVAVYKAPLSPEQEGHIVAYLTAVQNRKR